MKLWLVEEAYGTITVGVFSSEELARAAARRLELRLGEHSSIVIELTLDEEEAV